MKRGTKRVGGGEGSGNVFADLGLPHADVAAASGAASVRVWHITSRGWDPWTERPLPEVVRVAYPLCPIGEPQKSDYVPRHRSTA
jgi:hypothetical protein